MQSNKSKLKANSNQINVFSFKLLFYTFRFALFTLYNTLNCKMLLIGAVGIAFLLPGVTALYSRELTPHFQSAHYFFAATDSLTELHTYIKGDRADLLFERRGYNYLARVELNLVIYSSTGGSGINLVKFQTTKLDSFILSTYQETTVSESFLLGPFKAMLPPGKYRFIARLTDINSRREAMEDKEINIPLIGASGEPISSIILCDARGIPRSDNIFTIGEETLSYRFYAYKPADAGKGIITVALSRDERTFYSHITDFPPSSSQLYLASSFPIDTLLGGEYELTATLTHDSLTYTRTTTFKLLFTSYSLLRGDFDMAVEVLGYIATEAELDSLKERGLGSKERLKRWRDFWTRRDPTPGTEENEAMEEFYERVEYANEHFGGIKEGWRSDRGRIYITYGQPDEIERHPFDLESPPYEIWYYYGERLRFVFVDENNNGEYKLYETFNH